ncbi:beta-lactamase/transpeptidase-like protein [Apodospora peruviana]|uniref:Beta-lactamase/transpeptidase-like protein n=1 Tax=Apodospora peruviana TaxID=516989 RepID=A0AAE0IIG0_9PEZI|nr:beta-lactamase/transpeptidase-like protein [Apodospora peruviana]
MHLRVFAAVFMGVAKFGSAQNCPIAGPAYPAVTNVAASEALQAARTVFDQALAQTLADGVIDSNTTAFSIQVYSTHADNVLYQYHHPGPPFAANKTVGPDTLYRIGSVSKAIAVYAILAALSFKYWNEPITKYVPELDNLPLRSAVDDVNWDEVTLGALASHMAGIGNDYAVGDVPTGISGLPSIDGSAYPRCGTAQLRPCTRAESLQLMVAKPPVTPTYYSPTYSNMAFQLLAYAVENITGQSFSSLVHDSVISPLNLTRTFLSPPLNDTDAVVVDGFARDLGDAAPAGGYLQSPADLTALGKSILTSSLLPKSTTRQWLRPVTHSAFALHAVGAPWEIERVPVPVSPNPNTTTTRLLDVYTKSGGIAGYASLLALIPDHDIGITLLVADGTPARATATFTALLTLLAGTWLPAGEHAARAQAEISLAGKYTSPGDSGGSSFAEFTLLPNTPGLFLSRLSTNGTDILTTLLTSSPDGGPTSNTPFGAWLYPTGLKMQSSHDHNDGTYTKRLAFRAVLGRADVPASDATCRGVGVIDALRYGPYAVDQFVFRVDGGGRAIGVEVPVLQEVLVRT